MDQRILSPDEINSMPKFNRSIYDMLKQTGQEYKAFAKSSDYNVIQNENIANAISAATNGMCATIGLTPEEDLVKKLREIMKDNNIKSPDELNKHLKKLLKGKIKKQLLERGLTDAEVDGIETQIDTKEKIHDLEQMQKDREQLERQTREKDRADELLMIEAAKKLVKGLQTKAGQPADRASLALGAKAFEQLPDELLPEFMKYLKDNLGFELKGRDHGDILRDGREITEETVTREDLENGDIKLVISMDKLKSSEYARLLQEEQRTLDARETRVHEEATRDQRAQDTGETLTVKVNEGPEMD